MGKRRFTAEERIKIVELYIRNGIGYGPISKKYDVPETTLHHWVRKYNEKGAEGIGEASANRNLKGRNWKSCALRTGC